MVHDRSRSEYELAHFLISPKTTHKNKREQMRNSLPFVISVFFFLLFSQLRTSYRFSSLPPLSSPSILIPRLTIETFKYAIRLAPASIQTSLKPAAPSIPDFTDSRLTKMRWGKSLACRLETKTKLVAADSRNSVVAPLRRIIYP